MITAFSLIAGLYVLLACLTGRLDIWNLPKEFLYGMLAILALYGTLGCILVNIVENKGL